MAIIHFTAADVLATKIVEAKVYPCEISKLEGPKPSSTGNSNSYFCDITISDGPYKGKTRTIVFNTGTSSPSLLPGSDLQYFPVHYILQLDAAIRKLTEMVPQDSALDTESLVHKSLDVAWGVSTVEGRLINTINSFHPSGYAAAAPAF